MAADDDGAGGRADRRRPGRRAGDPTAASSSTPTPEAVGRAALDGGVALTRLGPSEGAGLEQLFFDLTAPAGIPEEVLS